MINIADFFWIALGDYLSTFQYHCSVADRDNSVDVVADKQDRFSAQLEIANTIERF